MSTSKREQSGSGESPQDSLYAAPLDKIADFRFDEGVARVFPDMIRRSVPGYGAIIHMLGVFADEYARERSLCYDLGCSLGAATLAMRSRIGRSDCRIIAVDSSGAMIERCRQNIAAAGPGVPVDLVCADIRDIAIERASVVVLNFTLQFLDPSDRLPMIRKIRSGMLPGGVMVLSEKIRFEDPEQDRLFVHLHHAFKRSNGYSDLEISQKRAALEKVLIPETARQHRERILEAGFDSCDVWFQSLNFISLIARA